MLILASGSPRRRELIEKLHLPFEVEVSGNEEIIPEGIEPKDLPEYLALEKAKDVFKKHKSESAIIIGADTVVLCGGRILGKPHSRQEAIDMLKSLSGRTHEVVTGVGIISDRGEHSFTDICEVEFYPLKDREIERYVDSGEPMDKAGAYGIQGDGALLVKGIRGDYYTVMGLPVARLYRTLSELGII